MDLFPRASIGTYHRPGLTCPVGGVPPSRPYYLQVEQDKRRRRWRGLASLQKACEEANQLYAYMSRKVEPFASTEHSRRVYGTACLMNHATASQADFNGRIGYAQPKKFCFFRDLFLARYGKIIDRAKEIYDALTLVDYAWVAGKSWGYPYAGSGTESVDAVMLGGCYARHEYIGKDWDRMQELLTLYAKEYGEMHLLPYARRQATAKSGVAAVSVSQENVLSSGTIWKGTQNLEPRPRDVRGKIFDLAFANRPLATALKIALFEDEMHSPSPETLDPFFIQADSDEDVSGDDISGFDSFCHWEVVKPFFQIICEKTGWSLDMVESEYRAALVVFVKGTAHRVEGGLNLASGLSFTTVAGHFVNGFAKYTGIVIYFLASKSGRDFVPLSKEIRSSYKGVADLGGLSNQELDHCADISRKFNRVYGDDGFKRYTAEFSYVRSLFTQHVPDQRIELEYYYEMMANLTSLDLSKEPVPMFLGQIRTHHGVSDIDYGLPLATVFFKQFFREKAVQGIFVDISVLSKVHALPSWKMELYLKWYRSIYDDTEARLDPVLSKYLDAGMMTLDGYMSLLEKGPIESLKAACRAASKDKKFGPKIDGILRAFTKGEDPSDRTAYPRDLEFLADYGQSLKMTPEKVAAIYSESRDWVKGGRTDKFAKRMLAPVKSYKDLVENVRATGDFLQSVGYKKYAGCVIFR